MKLSELIINSGHTDRELERLSGVSHTQIWRIKKNKYDPKLSTIDKILKALGKKFGDLD